MNNILIPNYFSLFKGGNEDIEVLELTFPNGSGECLHKYSLNVSLTIRLSMHNIAFWNEFEEDIKDSHIAIRGCEGGIQVVTSLRFLRGKLGNLFIEQNDYNDDQFATNIYFSFFLKSILYMINYYYFVLNEKDIRIQKDSFQTIFAGKANSYNTLLSLFERIEKPLIQYGLLKFLFEYQKDLDHFVFQEEAFLSLLSSSESIPQNYGYLQVLILTFSYYHNINYLANE